MNRASRSRRRAVLIAVTGGDPCGIGPEVLLKTLRTTALPPHVRLALIADHRVLARTARRLGRPLPAWPVLPLGSRETPRAPVTLLDCGSPGEFRPGRSTAAAGRASLTYLTEAVRLWRLGLVQGLVTAPVTKRAIDPHVRGGFTGQTEFLAKAMGRREVVMMFTSERLRVVLLTRHLPLRQAPLRVSAAEAFRAMRLTAGALRSWFGVRHPRLAVCGLNPHAGEGGLFGQEERRVLLPAMRRARAAGIACAGPYAADGFFASPAPSDAVVCWYHDQGLIPFKMLARDQGCQLTIGLPIVRTSPDHGSAPDIAGRGVADPGSMRYALLTAAALASASPRGA